MYTFIVPILLGSTRLPNKNLILLDGQPLCTYVPQILSKVAKIDQIVISYEDEIVRKAIEVTDPVPFVTFKKRDPKRGGSLCEMKNISADCNGKRCQVHDHYLYDLCLNLESEWIIQAHTTSPLISERTVQSFIHHLNKTSSDQVICVTGSKKEAYFNNKPINFDPSCKTPTQFLSPVQSIFWGLTAWRRKKFIETYENNQSPSFLENLDLFVIPEEESLDIDTLEECIFASHVLQGKRVSYIDSGENLHYFDLNIVGIERDLDTLLEKDGSALPTLDSSSQKKISLDEIVAIMGSSKSWSYPIMVSGQDQSCIIHQVSGESCRKHSHITKAEFWYVLQGTFEWILNDQTFIVSKGEFMRLKPGEVHTIKCVSEEPGIRFAIGGYNMEHIYY